MTPEESQELYDAVSAVEQQDVHLGRVLKSIIGYLPGFALPEPEPVPAEQPAAEAPPQEPAAEPAPEAFPAPVESEQANAD